MNGWTRTEVGVLVRAVGNAPSVHDTMPWVLETHDNRAELYERADRRLPRHDPTGRDRLISCGAALTNLRLAVRSLGRLDQVELLPDPGRPDLIACVNASVRQPATEVELAWYWAMFRRRSHRRPFTDEPVGDCEIQNIIDAGSGDGVRLHRVKVDDCVPVVGLLGYAAEVLRADRGLQRELEAWTSRYGAHVGPEDSAMSRPPPENTLPWAGLVRPSTRLPDARTLALRLAHELVLVVVTDSDTAFDHLHAGAAAQRLWLAAVVEGLAGAVMTQPLHLEEVRTGLIDQLALPGYPQVIFRIGHPAAAIKARQRDARDHLHRTGKAR